MTLEGLLALLILSQDMWCPPLSFLFCFRSHFYPVKQSFKQQWNAASTPRHKLHLVQSSGRTVPGTVDRNLLGFKLIPTTWLMRWRGWINKTPSMFVGGKGSLSPRCTVTERPWSCSSPDPAASCFLSQLREAQEQAEEEVSWRTAASPASSTQIRPFW